ncbi:MAG: hypothetical protein ABI675_22060 [Chitinophagaceae bacterium]
MKKYVCLFTILLVSATSFAQRDENIGKYFQFLENIQLEKCDAVGSGSGTKVIISRDIQFTIVSSTAADYVIFILSKPKDDAFNKKYFNTAYVAKTTKTNDPDIYFLLPREAFSTKCKSRLKKNSLSVGLVNLPIKARFGSKKKTDGIYNKDFLISSDVSLGFSIGYKRKWSEENGLNLLGGISVSSIQVDSSITKGYATSATNASALTGHVGILFETNNFQFGIFTGIDFLAGQMGKEFLYKKDPWLGIAIGFSLFKAKSTKETQ